jgi:hypothetical protein
MYINKEKPLPKINRITHKEIMLLWGLSSHGAVKRLKVLKSSIDRERSNYLTVTQFCQAENISLEEFDTLIARAYNG